MAVIIVYIEFNGFVTTVIIVILGGGIVIVMKLGVVCNSCDIFRCKKVNLNCKKLNIIRELKLKK